MVRLHLQFFPILLHSPRCPSRFVHSVIPSVFTSVLRCVHLPFFFQVLLPFCSKVPNKLPAVAAVSYPLVLTDVTFDSMLAVGCVTRAFSEQCTQEGDVQ